MRDYTTFLQKESVVIFLFHGVIRKSSYAVRNYTSKHLLVDRFVSILERLTEEGNAVSMPELVQASRGGTNLPERAFAVTFDDGFKNNLTVAAPILEAFKIPAVFYVTTHFIETNGSSWIDQIEYAVERTPSVRLSLPFLNGGGFTTRDEKLKLLEAIRTYVKSDARIDPYAFAAKIWRQLGIEAMEPDEALDQKMDWEDLRRLSGNPLFTVGGHGHTHRILTYLTPAELDEEISLSLAALQKQLGRPIEHYSYPEGLSHCYSESVIQSLCQKGIVCCPTAEPGTNGPGEDLFRLKRIMVT